MTIKPVKHNIELRYLNYKKKGIFYMKDSLSEKLLQQIYNFTNITHRQYHQQNSTDNDLSIDRGQGHLLGILLTHDGLTQKELSSQLQIRAASLGELVDKLERSGYVERRVNEKDKRVSNVYLKEEGRKLVEEIVKSRNLAVDNIFSAISEGEKNQLAYIMGKILDSIKERSVDNMDDLGGQDMIRDVHHLMRMGEFKDFQEKSGNDNCENSRDLPNDRGHGFK